MTHSLQSPDLRLRRERRRRPLEPGAFHLLTALTAPEIVNPDRQRPPLNLAFVVDRSGSMSGGKLELAMRGVDYALRAVDDRDRVALVVYDDRIETLLSLRHADSRARDKAARRLRRVTPRGSTDLAGGWLTGCDQLAGVADGDDGAGQALCRAILLTDGLANVGLTDALELARHAGELRRRGISTSTFGVGDDYDEELLAQMADAGGGHYHWIANANSIPDAFRGELGELLSIAMRDAMLSLRFPAGWQVSLLNDLPLEREDGRTLLRLGELASRERRALVWRLELPPATEGDCATIDVQLRWRDANGAGASELNLVHTIVASAEPGDLDPEAQDELAFVLGGRARREAIAHHRAGRHEQARVVAAAYAAAMPATAAGRAEAASLLEDATAVVTAAELKRQHATAYQRARSRPDYTKPR